MSAYYTKDQVDAIAPEIGARIAASAAQPGRDAYDFVPTFAADASVYIPAHEAMTLAIGNPKIGIGNLSYQQSTAASPGQFTDTALPAALEAGAWLKVSAIGVDGFCAIHMRRTA